MARPVSLFHPYNQINQAYGKLRQLVVTKELAPEDRSARINHFAVGFVRQIAAEVLDAETIESILAPYGGRGAWESGGPLLKFTPKLVEAAISSGRLAETEIARRIGDEDAFFAFAAQEKAHPGNRSVGYQRKAKG